jgi:hypothetical protein
VDSLPPPPAKTKWLACGNKVQKVINKANRKENIETTYKQTKIATANCKRTNKAENKPGYYISSN